MKTFFKQIAVLILVYLFTMCGSHSIQKKQTEKEEPIVIKNDNLQYEIIVIEPGFSTYLHTVAKPEGYYSQNFLENRNQIYVTTWNIRASNPTQYNPTIYENSIDYNSNVNYGYDVNYKLYNYFEFIKQKYNIKLP